MPHAGRATISRWSMPCAAAEIDFIEAQRAAIAPADRRYPRSDVDGFIAWFERLQRDRARARRSTVSLACRDGHARADEMVPLQEVAGEAGFDDLLAMTQVKMPVQAKLEMARNYWDEMGRGAARACTGRCSNVSRAFRARADARHRRPGIARARQRDDRYGAASPLCLPFDRRPWRRSK